MVDHDEAASKKPGSSNQGCVGCLGIGILLLSISLGPSSILIAVTADKGEVPVLPLVWAIPLTVVAFIVAELVIRRLAARTDPRTPPSTSNPHRTPVGSWWMRLAFLPLFLVNGVLVAGAYDWPGSVTAVLAAVLGLLLALVSSLVGGMAGNLSAMLACVAAFAVWAVMALATGPGRTTLASGVLFAVLMGATWLWTRSSRSRSAA